MPRRDSASRGPDGQGQNGHDGRADDEDDEDDAADEADDDADPSGPAAPDIGAPIPGTLAELLDLVAAGVDDVTRRPTAAGIDYLVRDRMFVSLAGNRATFRLRPEIAAAAARTPDAARADDGPEWVSFAPSRLDRYGADRATAWFELGHRLAAEAARAN